MTDAHQAVEQAKTRGRQALDPDLLARLRASYDKAVESGRVHILQDKTIPSYVSVFRIHGPLLFGVTDKVSRIVDRIPSLPPVVVARLRNMTAIDATGLQALEKLGVIAMVESKFKYGATASATAAMVSKG